MEQMNGRQSRASASRCTRSQAAPDWTAQESMILVNEVAAVEGECRKSFSSYQKWKIVVENCNALDVPRSLNQCRRKWDSLLTEYKKIKRWESESPSRSYFDLQREERRQFRVPESFDAELFKAIDDYIRAEEGKSDTEPESDPEARAIDVLDVIAESGSKKKRSKTMHRNQSFDKRVKAPKHIEKIVQEQTIEAQVKPPQSSFAKEELPEQCSKDVNVKPPAHNIYQKIISGKMNKDDRKQMMAAKLYEDVEMINAVLQGNLSEDDEEDHASADLRNVEASRTRFVRRQGDKLISCFENLVDTLDQLCNVVQEHN